MERAIKNRVLFATTPYPIDGISTVIILLD